MTVMFARAPAGFFSRGTNLGTTARTLFGYMWITIPLQ